MQPHNASSKRPGLNGLTGGCFFAVVLTLSLCGVGRAADPGPQTRPAPQTSGDPALPDGGKDAASALTVASAIAQLGAAKYAPRDNAEHFLMQQSPRALPAVEAALQSSNDSEVLARLTRVAMHLFLKGRTQFDGGASLLGIGLSLETLRIGPHDDDLRTVITIMALQPGFPAAEVLRPGDRIIAMNNEPFPLDMSIDFFRRHITTTPPGTVIRLTVLRGNEQLDVPVMLAGIPDAGDEAIAEFILDRQRAAAAYLKHLHAGHENPLTIPSQDDPVESGGPDNIVIRGGQ